MQGGNEIFEKIGEDEKKQPPAKKKKLNNSTEIQASSDEEGCKQTNIENYSHSHWPKSNVVRTLYVGEKASIIYGKSNIPFLTPLDETLLKHARNASKSSGNNWLFLSIHFGKQDLEGIMQWKDSPLYYNEQSTKFCFSFDEKITDQSTFDHLKLGAFRVPTQEEDQILGNYHYVGKRKLHEKLTKPESYLVTFNGGFHTEIQALSLLLDEWSMLFDDKISANNPDMIFIKMHSYNDICGGCQSYILNHHELFQTKFRNHFSKIPNSKITSLAFLGVVSKPYGMNNYYRTKDEPCECTKPYSNWSYLREKVDGVETRDKLKEFLIQEGTYTYIEPYVDVCELGALDSSFKPYDGEVDLFSIEQGKQSHLLTFIKRPNLSYLNIKLPKNLAHLASCYGIQ